MDEDAKTTAKRPRGSAKAPLTVEAAQEQILKKLEKFGAKGTTAPYSKKPPQNAAAYEQALAALQDDQRPEIFVDGRGKKPKFYLWAYRPNVPTKESVARQILAFASAEHPKIHHQEGLTKGAGITKDGKKLVQAAVELLCSRGQLAALQFAASAKKIHQLFVVSSLIEPSARMDEPPATTFPDSTPQEPLTLDELKPAYDELFRKTGFPAVAIASLLKLCGVSAQRLKDLLRREHNQGRVVLSVGDWSIASDEERQAVIEMDGAQYLQVRWR